MCVCVEVCGDSSEGRKVVREGKYFENFKSKLMMVRDDSLEEMT